jgi:CRISPR-associated protein Cas1
VGICLPDEVNLLSVRGPAIKPEDLRRLSPARDDALPMYVQTQGAAVGKSGDQLQIKFKGEVLQKARLLEISHLALFGNVQISAQALRELCDRNIPICHFTYGGWFQGITSGMAHKNVELRCRQFLGAATPETFLPIARQIVFGKIKNCRTLLRRNHRQPPPGALAELDRLADTALQANSLATLLGLEGAAARAYFAEFSGMIKTNTMTFDFHGRTRRPPRDPVNAVLSFLYAMLMKQTMVTCLAVGFDPYLGFYHQPKYGKPALALDLAEEFRPLVADSVCLSLINNGELTGADLIARSGSVALTQPGRRKVIEAYERRMDSLITHPLFGYAISYRRILEVQARLLSRHLLGEIPTYPPFRTR